MKIKIFNFLILALVTINAVAEDFVFKDDDTLSVTLCCSSDLYLKKQFGTGAGKTIKIREFNVSGIATSAWEKGGSLELQTERTLGISNMVSCELSPSLGDKFMKEEKKKRTISITGKIKHYSSDLGLIIDPCNATW